MNNHRIIVVTICQHTITPGSRTRSCFHRNHNRALNAGKLVLDGGDPCLAGLTVFNTAREFINIVRIIEIKLIAQLHMGDRQPLIFRRLQPVEGFLKRPREHINHKGWRKSGIIIGQL